MVAGDLVNTASRIQSAAEPGTVLVGDATRRATEPTIVYEDAGTHELKGKAEPCALWRALRVVVGRARRAQVDRASSRRSSGRDRELRLVKELFHASAEERKAAPRLGDGHRRDRQVAARVGVLQVLRRPRRQRLLAPRPLPRLRRGRRRTGRSPTWCACAAASPRTTTTATARSKLDATLEEHLARRRRSGASSSRGSRTCSGSGRRSVARAAGPLRGLAALLRAARRRVPDRARVRGHAVGRREPARLRRVPARVVAQLTRSSSSRSPGPSCSTSGRTGAPGTATSRRSTSSRSPRTAMERAARRPRARAARRAARADPRPRRGRAAVRGRDGADAARPRPARPGRARLPADGRDRVARGARDAARARRRPPRRARRRRSAACSRTRGPRQDLHARRRSRRVAGVDRGRARAAPRRARAQGDPRRAGRPALARARPVRLPPGPRAPRRLRDALEEGAQARHLAAAEYLEQSRSANEDEIAEVLASHYLDAYAALPDADDAERDQRRRRATRSCAPASAPSRSARRRRRCATSSRR